MRFHIYGFSIVVFLLVVAIQEALAAPWEAGSKRLTKMNNSYDPSKFESIAGKVIDIHEAQPADAPNYGYHMIVKTEVEEIHVHLGPIWYIENLISQIHLGDSVTVNCARVEKPEEYKGVVLRAVRASEVWQNTKLVLKLRELSGKPLWSGL
jgi:hypothetical protein